MGYTIRIAIGVFALFNVLYKLFTCASCDESIFGFPVSGLVYIIFSTAVAVLILYMAYKRKQQEGQV
ncbi:MAG: hypothetical protein AB8F78_03690 [Saprospiraceae bacterium]